MTWCGILRSCATTAKDYTIRCKRLQEEEHERILCGVADLDGAHVGVGGREDLPEVGHPPAATARHHRLHLEQQQHIRLSGKRLWTHLLSWFCIVPQPREVARKSWPDAPPKKKELTESDALGTLSAALLLL
jgi:hypothetical protein